MTTATKERFPTWPLWLLALPAAVAIWSGWVGLGQMAGFGPVTLLPGISDMQINSAVTLPIGMEAFAAYSLRAWLSPLVPPRARSFARTSAILALSLGALGQVFYHLMVSAGVTKAPWPVTAFVATLPVMVLGMGAALAHMITVDNEEPAAQEQREDTSAEAPTENTERKADTPTTTDHADSAPPATPTPAPALAPQEAHPPLETVTVQDTVAVPPLETVVSHDSLNEHWDEPTPDDHSPEEDDWDQPLASSYRPTATDGWAAKPDTEWSAVTIGH